MGSGFFLKGLNLRQADRAGLPFDPVGDQGQEKRGDAVRSGQKAYCREQVAGQIEPVFPRFHQGKEQGVGGEKEVVGLNLFDIPDNIPDLLVGGVIPVFEQGHQVEQPFYPGEICLLVLVGLPDLGEIFFVAANGGSCFPGKKLLPAQHPQRRSLLLAVGKPGGGGPDLSPDEEMGGEQIGERLAVFRGQPLEKTLVLQVFQGQGYFRKMEQAV